MSYQVLARKYRPQSFTQFVGQESTCRILKNSLEMQRIHHAYLFTGTRGVGKTTLARLLAKCLNCQTKITSTPCGHCTACQAINTHRFTDLMEVDAASRTKVEDTRDLLADVHYAPSQGRYKIYLIDEIHMLSSHSFNALLKTLEEPPPHVIFLLATTDPQRLPATILSRCLQFHLKILSIEQITTHLAMILKNEQVPYEPSALLPLASAAQGSLRDALSLLDQAIAYTHHSINEQEVIALLGGIKNSEIVALLEAFAVTDTVALWAIVDKLNEQAVDFLQVIDELLTFLHHIALAQTLTEAIPKQSEALSLLAKKFPPEDIQLYYQIALLAKRDLALAPTPRLGFEMMLLRMLSFKPVIDDTEDSSIKTVLFHQEVPEKQYTPPITCDKTIASTTLDWSSIVKQLNIAGITYTFACQCALQSYRNHHVSLLLDPKQAALRSPQQETKLAQALSNYFGHPITLEINLGNADLLTPAHLAKQEKSQRLTQITEVLKKDPTVQTIIKTFDATLQPESIQFPDESCILPENLR